MMTTKFYTLENNSNWTRGFPWVSRIINGLKDVMYCDLCKVTIDCPVGTVQVTLQSDKGIRWPDILGCGGGWPLTIVSQRVLSQWREDGIGEFPVDKLEILNPVPKKLPRDQMPEYFWLDGEQMLGAKVDFDASGYVDVRFCPKCGRRTHDISATYDRQHSGVWPIAFVPESWNGANVFTTDLSPAAFFCTEKVVECARKHRHTNFKFVPAERAGSSLQGIDYLKR